jgi:hypothetical protein
VSWGDFLAQEGGAPLEEEEVDLLEFVQRVAPSEAKASTQYFRPRLNSLRGIMQVPAWKSSGAAPGAAIGAGDAALKRSPSAARSSALSALSPLPKVEPTKLKDVVKAVKALTGKAREGVAARAAAEGDGGAIEASVEAKAMAVTTACKRYFVAIGGVQAASKLPTTVEELKLPDVMAFGSMREHFSAFLRSQLCEESIKFWTAVQRLKLLTARQNRRAFLDSRSIYAQFVVDGAEEEINVSAAAKRQLTAALAPDAADPDKPPSYYLAMFKSSEHDVWQNMVAVFGQFVAAQKDAIASGLQGARKAAGDDYFLAKTELLRVSLDLAEYSSTTEQHAALHSAIDTAAIEHS